MKKHFIEVMKSSLGAGVKTSNLIEAASYLGIGKKPTDVLASLYADTLKSEVFNSEDMISNDVGKLVGQHLLNDLLMADNIHMVREEQELNLSGKKNLVNPKISTSSTQQGLVCFWQEEPEFTTYKFILFMAWKPQQAFLKADF
jgi:hypothetical protein